MPRESSLLDVLRNLLQYGDLPFRDYVELALYHPEFGYYAREENPVGKEADYVTAPLLSPAFSFALGRLVNEFVRRCEGVVCSIVDIGCGDGGLIRAIAEHVRAENTRFFGVDRSLSRITVGAAGLAPPVAGAGGASPAAPTVTFVKTIDELPRDGCHLLLSNELFDAFPFARLVRRGDELHELWVTERDGALDWHEHEAAAPYGDYFAARGIELEDGQFADISLEWNAYYGDLARLVKRGLIVTIDYGFEQKKLFHPRIRRFGTAASYSQQRVTRDLLANPGGQDLTAHINFTDLERRGEREGLTTLAFERLNGFLLAIGIGEHELFRPAQDVTGTVELIDAREDARRLVLPDGIGEEMRVLVQGSGIPTDGWSFQQRLW